MNWRIILAVGLACTTAIPASVLASHFGSYAATPTEHDDMGSSNEPDHLVTSVLGPTVANRVVDYNNDWVAEGDSVTPIGKVLAPGCTDANGRQQNGLCGSWTIGVGTGATGVASIAPRHTIGPSEGPGPGLTGKGVKRVNFLDASLSIDITSAGTTGMNFNKKVSDSPLAGTLASAGMTGGTITPGPSMLWSWFGSWSDLNGNGVIDHLASDNAGHVYADNEFVWSGQCRAFDGSHTVSDVCSVDPKGRDATGAPNDVMYGFIYPGNHHANCGGLTNGITAGASGAECAYIPADGPGKQVIGVADAMTMPVTTPALGSGIFLLGTGCNTFFFTDADTGCETDIAKADDNDARYSGDILLGDQSSVKPDQTFDDRSGEPSAVTRMFIFGLGWPSWYYDAGLITTTTFVTTIGCQDDISSPNTIKLDTCRFADVDRYNTVSPTAESALGGVKVVGRTNWVLARDTIIPVQTTLAGATGSYLLYSTGGNGAAQGSLDDQVFDPGRSREPNAPGDSFPGAVRGTCATELATHQGWCNSYAGYKSGYHAWTDNQDFRAEYWSFPLGVSGTCVTCVAGSTFTVGPPLNLPHNGGSYSRTLQPGGYNFIGVIGLWKDNAQTWTETFIDTTPGSPTFGQTMRVPHTAAPDGWVGNVVNRTGDFYYRGYPQSTCTTENGAGSYPFAVCNPYHDGNIQDPQQAGDTTNGEWKGRCVDPVLTLHPAGGTWTVPVVIFRNHEHEYDVDAVGLGTPEDITTAVSVETGLVGDITMRMSCRGGQDSGVYVSGDMIYLPEGNMGLDVTATLVGHVTLDNNVVETVTDADQYFGWGA